MRLTIQINNDRPLHRLNYQLEASIHFNLPMVGQYDVISIGTIKIFLSYSMTEVHWSNCEQNFHNMATSFVYLKEKILELTRGNSKVINIFMITA